MTKYQSLLQGNLHHPFKKPVLSSTGLTKCCLGCHVDWRARKVLTTVVHCVTGCYLQNQILFRQFLNIFHTSTNTFLTTLMKKDDTELNLELI